MIDLSVALKIQVTKEADTLRVITMNKKCKCNQFMKFRELHSIDNSFVCYTFLWYTIFSALDLQTAPTLFASISNKQHSEYSVEHLCSNVMLALQQLMQSLTQHM